MDDSLIAAHRDLPALMPHLHLPVQSGSDRMLAAMNRRHTRADYLNVVDALRAARPDIAFCSDFIVGYPGESEDDFAPVLRLVDEVGFASAYSFKYSPRPGTPAAELEQLPEEVKDERLRACTMPSTASRLLSTRAASASPSTCCSKSPAAFPARSSAARLICSRCRS